MFASLRKRFKNLVVSLRFSILSIFSLLFLFLLATVLANFGLLIATIAPEAEFRSRLKYIEGFYLLLDLFIFLLGFVLMWHLVTKITKPINNIVAEIAKIKNFHLNRRAKIKSHIKEIIDIDHAILDLKTGLRSFKRYVPASLVRQLIKTGEGAKLGATKRKLAIFFSDISNFTAIAERTDSQQLIQQMSEYFEELSRIIIYNNGTIDKYIGDSLMSFWGAPLYVIYPCRDAARTALLIQQKLKQLNALWQESGYSPLITRIGIHFGEAIVGNIGSSERLNYTVLGDNVNIAGHLVDVNKIYGTSILVSDTVYQEVKNSFVLRFVDHVTLKGKLEITVLYELLAFNADEIAFDINAYEHTFMAGFHAYQQKKWADAIKYFNDCLSIYPDDKLVRVFIVRCQVFAQNEPVLDWNGVWHLS